MMMRRRRRMREEDEEMKRGSCEHENGGRTTNWRMQNQILPRVRNISGKALPLPELPFFFQRRAATRLRGFLSKRAQQPSNEDAPSAARGSHLAEASRLPRRGAAKPCAAHRLTPSTRARTGSRRILLENCVGRLTGRRRRARSRAGVSPHRRQRCRLLAAHAPRSSGQVRAPKALLQLSQVEGRDFLREI